MEFDDNEREYKVLLLYNIVVFLHEIVEMTKKLKLCGDSVCVGGCDSEAHEIIFLKLVISASRYICFTWRFLYLHIFVDACVGGVDILAAAGLQSPQPGIEAVPGLCPVRPGSLSGGDTAYSSDGTSNLRLPASGLFPSPDLVNFALLMTVKSIEETGTPFELLDRVKKQPILSVALGSTTTITITEQGLRPQTLSFDGRKIQDGK